MSSRESFGVIKSSILAQICDDVIEDIETGRVNSDRKHIEKFRNKVNKRRENRQYKWFWRKLVQIGIADLTEVSNEQVKSFIEADIERNSYHSKHFHSFPSDRWGRQLCVARRLRTLSRMGGDIQVSSSDWNDIAHKAAEIAYKTESHINA